MKKITSVVITTSIATVDAEGNTIDNVLHVSDSINCDRAGVAVQKDLADLNKTIKFGMDRLQAKLSGQLDLPIAPLPIADTIPLAPQTDSEAEEKAPTKRK